ncbi:hypothetical protein BDQ12DRAFT_686291 [Crucibulum laeve]|uniref:J domain-containing protein n=1 Tax=Crucibulum laeve TaxID=68775 RepID=A0A5C3LTY6_9AGAR|nr:hypothetical protein BDQ12DRAFT_686291 [Crucibulum laeve]
MDSETDYYKLLGVPKNATDDEIKKAYKRMALKNHPDRNKGSEESSRKFKEISEAFEVLSDKDKRAIYDQFGMAGLKGGGPAPGAGTAGGFPGGFSSAGGFPGGGGTTFTFTSGPGGFGGGRGGGFNPTDPQKIFEQMFGSGGLGAAFGMGGGGRRGGMSSMFGGDDDDDDMGGFSSFSSAGGMPGGMPRQRPSAARQHSHFGASGRNPSPEKPSEITRPLKVSLQDLYSGAVKHLKVGRRLLDGTTEDKVLEIQIHPGWKSGTKIRFPRAGNEQPQTGEAQDLVFVVEEKPHETFSREGNDLICRLKIPLVEALTGASGAGKLTKTLEMLDGRKMQIPVPMGIVKPGQEMTIPGEGMPIRKDGATKRKGDLIVKWEVVFPDRLTAAQKEGLRKVLTGA